MKETKEKETMTAALGYWHLLPAARVWVGRGTGTRPSLLAQNSGASERSLVEKCYYLERSQTCLEGVTGFDTEK